MEATRNDDRSSRWEGGDSINNSVCIRVCCAVGVLNMVHKAALQTMREGVPGHWLEAGVWRGGTSLLLRAIQRVYQLNDRAVILADSFDGIPSTSLMDWDERYKVDKKQVMDNLNR